MGFIVVPALCEIELLSNEMSLLRLLFFPVKTFVGMKIKKGWKGVSIQLCACSCADDCWSQIRQPVIVKEKVKTHKEKGKQSTLSPMGDY
jgi:hypothetical protein